VRQGELFLALDARSDARSVTREALVRIANRVELSWLEELFPQSIRKVRRRRSTHSANASSVAPRRIISTCSSARNSRRCRAHRRRSSAV
jgi:hypothetical protein